MISCGFVGTATKNKAFDSIRDNYDDYDDSCSYP